MLNINIYIIQVVELKRTPKGDDRRMRATLKKATLKTDSNTGSELHQKIRVLADENFKYSQLLERVKTYIIDLSLLSGKALSGRKKSKNIQF